MIPETLLNKVVEGDCLQVMFDIPSKSIDMILCDLPYGTTQNRWDSVIDLNKLWHQYLRIIKDNGCIALTAQGLFTAKLIMSCESLFRYKIIWIKSKPTNFLNAKKQPLRKHEDICIFYKNQPTYNPQMTEGGPYDKGVRKDQFTGSYGEFKPRHVQSEGGRYPVDIIQIDPDKSEFDDFYYQNNETDVHVDSVDEIIYIKTAESEGIVHHPTQKPVKLGRNLIRTFTNKGDVVLDNACGSGSFLVAAALEQRNYIGIEKNEDVLLHKKYPIDYVAISSERIRQALDSQQFELGFAG